MSLVSAALPFLRRHSLWLLFPVFLAAFLLAPACGSGLDLPLLEKEAQAVDRTLICPVCPGETIDQSQVELAKQMQALVREQLQAGWSKEQIQDFFVERYGPSVLASPPQSGFNLVAWIVPPAGVLVGIVVLWTVLRGISRRPSRQTAPPTGGEDPDALKPYLLQVDALLGQEPSPDPTNKGGTSGDGG